MENFKLIRFKNDCYCFTKINEGPWFREYGLKFERVNHVSDKELFKVIQRNNNKYTHVYKIIKEDLQMIKTALLLKTLDINNDLMRYKNHHRLRVFYNKGLKCANPNCNKEGHRLLIVLRGNGIHVDVFTKDYELMTIDHILPKSKGGTDGLYNLRPMCEKCNSKLGNLQSY